MSEEEQQAYNEALRDIEDCHRNQDTALNLGGRALTALPPEICQLTALRTLGLSGNEITTLPPEIGQLTALRVLSLRGNHLSALPLEIAQLTALTRLDLANNRLTTLPPEIGCLTALTRVDLDGNQLTALPAEIGQLRALTRLYLFRNQLTSLPAEIGQLRALKQLYLLRNQLTALPAEIGQLTGLEELYLHDNPRLGLIEDALGPTWMDVVVNKTGVPKPPREILEHYFIHQQAAQESGTEPLMEAKILVLGEASVGKSCLIAALSEGRKRSQLDGKGTSGIVRKLWEVPVSGEGLAADPQARGVEKLRLNLWDFGGQEIYHSAHTLFLTRRAIYLIVVSKRDNERQNNIDYWLRMAASFGGPEAVAYVVVNKSDEQVGHPPDEQALRRKYPQVRGFLHTSCDDLGGVAEAREIIVHEALRLEGVRLPVARTWLAMKRALETLHDHTLSMEQWAGLCTKHRVTLAEAQREVLHLCDRLGTVRYFPTKESDVPELSDNAILNPEWVTLGIYALFDDAELKAHGGLLDRAQMTRILVGRKYSSAQERIIEEVMRRFDLLYDSADRGVGHRMLIPLMLPEREPEMHWPKEGTLEFVYQYEVVPAGLVPAFMARMHASLNAEVPPWRNGCVLRLKAARVRVIGDAEAKRVLISVTGPEPLRRDALDKVRATFDALHGAVENLPVEQLIPVPGHTDAPMLDYEFVRSLEWKGEPEFVTKGAQRGETISVNVREALDGVRGEARKQRDDEQRKAARPGGDVHYHQHKHMGDHRK